MCVHVWISNDTLFPSKCTTFDQGSGQSGAILDANTPVIHCSCVVLYYCKLC